VRRRFCPLSSFVCLGEDVVDLEGVETVAGEGRREGRREDTYRFASRMTTEGSRPVIAIHRTWPGLTSLSMCSSK